VSWTTLSRDREQTHVAVPGLGRDRPVHSTAVGTTVSDPLVGRLLDGRYQVESRLARGGMATVYEALDTRLDRTIALKVMHPGLAEDRDFVARFIREAKSAARLSHPNVVAVYDQGTDDGHVFLAMEYVRGRTLRDLLRERDRLTPREAFTILEPVLAALAAAHRAGLIHRDVKPENVLLADDGRIKVADFGLARAVSGNTTTSTVGLVMGTVAYLSPEQVERGVADPRSDVYAAGILLFEMLTGSKPFAGDTPIQVAYQHVHNDVPAPSTRRGGLPAAVDGLVGRATRRDPDGRPADASAFLAELSKMRRALTDAELDTGGGRRGLLGNPFRSAAVVPAAGDEQTLVVNGTGARGSGDDERTAVVPLPASDGDGYPAPAAPTAFARRRRGSLALALVVAVALLASVGAWWLGSGRYTSTPSLLEMDRTAAVAAAKKAGLDLRFGATQFSETVPAGRVVDTDPDPGKRIRRDGTITAFLSKGPERYGVPKLAGQTREQAERTLKATNLTLGEVREEFHLRVAKGRVIRSEPEPGSRLRRDTAVAIVISKGPEPVQIPDVVDKLFDEAVKILKDRGLLLSKAEAFHDTVKKGRVIRTEPAVGTTVGKGSTIRVVVSKGPELIKVPRVVGMRENQAKRVLERAGFTVRVLSLPGGGRRVLAQNPSADSEAPKGSTVTISVF
jgi:beta-lactam-binding protein with PASTA domain/predicted Ser/Thr protein kinase